MQVCPSFKNCPAMFYSCSELGYTKCMYDLGEKMEYPQEIKDKLQELEMRCLVVTDIQVTEHEKHYEVNCKVNNLNTILTVMKYNQD